MHFKLEHFILAEVNVLAFVNDNKRTKTILITVLLMHLGTKPTYQVSVHFNLPVNDSVY